MQKGKRENPSKIKWSKPRLGWYKLNTDGSVRESLRSATAGGLIRDDSGEWLAGFICKLGDVSIILAELLAAREGLKLAWERRIRKIELEVDSEIVMNLIKNADIDCHPHGNIILDCRLLIQKPWDCRVVHTKRSGNECADALAKMGHTMEEDFRILEEAPPALVPLLLEDAL